RTDRRRPVHLPDDAAQRRDVVAVRHLARRRARHLRHLRVPPLAAAARRRDRAEHRRLSANASLTSASPPAAWLSTTASSRAAWPASAWAAAPAFRRSPAPCRRAGGRRRRPRRAG